MTTMTDNKNRIVFDSDQKSRLKLSEQLSVLDMTPGQRKKLTRTIARDVRSLARRNVRMQKTVDGSLMAKRANSRNKRKMLRGLAKTMIAFSRNNDTAVVTWKDRRNASIAYRQHHGSRSRMTARKAAQHQSTVKPGDRATRDQAKALLKKGYRQPIRKKNGGSSTKRVSQRWIMDNLTMRQAGYALQILTNNPKRQSWSIKLPARPFLGTSDHQASNFRQQIAKVAIGKLKDKGAI